MNLEKFKSTYYYKEDLVKICKENNLPYSGLLKIDLEKVIIDFLSGKKIEKSDYKIEKNKNWKQDKLGLNEEVTLNYRSNELTRKFFESILGKKFRFSGAMMHYKKLNPNKKVLYKDLVEVYYKELENKKNGKSSTEIYYKANRYNKFVKAFYADLKNKNRTRKDMILAWKKFKLSGKVNDL